MIDIWNNKIFFEAPEQYWSIAESPSLNQVAMMGEGKESESLISTFRPQMKPKTSYGYETHSIGEDLNIAGTC